MSPTRSAFPKMLAALALAGLGYCAARPDRLGEAERAALAGRFRFGAHTLPELPGLPHASERRVHPSLKPIAGWVSAVGASVALCDLDGDGLENDACYVDTRVDRLIAAPVPGTGARYEPFSFDAAPLPWDETMAPMGGLPGDFNEDGLCDLLAYYWGRTPIAFLRVPAPGGVDALGRSGFRAVEVVGGRDRWFTNAVTQADVDGDGHVDLVIGNYYPDGARILDPDAAGTETMQDSMSHALNGGRNRILLWAGAAGVGRPDVRFREDASVLDRDVACGWTLAVGAADLDGDLLPELYFANDFGPDRLLHNRSEPGRPRFAVLHGSRTILTPKSKVVGGDSFKGMGVDFADVNGDGRLDIYVSNIADEFALEESHFLFASTGPADAMSRGVAPFSDESEALGLSRSGWAWDARLADFDNDGVPEAVQATGFLAGHVARWPELHELAMGNDQLLGDPRHWFRCVAGDDLSGGDHNPFFVRAADGRYYDLSADVGLARPRVSRGLATADVDGDGDLDLAVANQWSSSEFLRNDSPAAGASLVLALRLPADGPGRGETVREGFPTLDPPTRPAFGAEARVRLPDGRVLVSFVDGGNGHSGRRGPAVHFGLGRVGTDAAVPVAIRWRDVSGQPHGRTLSLTPGTYTVTLAGPAEEI